jgi:hypothetical protein
MNTSGLPPHDPEKQFVTETGEIVDLPAFPWRAVFRTTFNDFRDRIDQECVVLEREMGVDADILLYNAEFPDGNILMVWPEEVGDVDGIDPSERHLWGSRLP